MGARPNKEGDEATAGGLRVLESGEVTVEMLMKIGKEKAELLQEKAMRWKLSVALEAARESHALEAERCKRQPCVGS